MMPKAFGLRPFPAAGLPPGIEITGYAARSEEKLSVKYELRGPLTQLLIPAPADMPARRDKLWEETCFEFFLGPKNSDRYWEFNLSPAGHWNVYRFASYRAGMQLEQAFTALPFSAETGPDSLILSVDADLTSLIRSDGAVDAGISAVVRLIDGTLTYWALTHPGPEPDFHRRDGFIFEL
ncbi:MAG: DOMON-like domain-containing protein [Nitrospiraceae bacterium]|nr:DOMON-like domain-containing protein [Nitrospiraceae bacterium]